MLNLSGFRLPIAEPPKVYENIPGYLTRLSELNGYERPRWIYQMLVEDCSDVSYAVLSAIAERLPELTGTSEVQINAIRYSSSAAENHNIINIGSRGNVAANLMDIRHPRICPECVLEFGTAFAVWDFKFYDVCSRHQCRLIDRCTNIKCGRKLTWWRPKLGRCAGCDEPFRSRQDKEVSDLPLLAFSSFLERNWLVPFPTELGDLGFWGAASFSDVTDSIQMLASRFTVALGVELRASQLPYREIIRAVAQAFYDWPNGFFGYIEALIKADLQEGRGFSIVNTSRLGSLFHRLMGEPRYSCQERLRGALLEYVHESKFSALVTGKGGNRLNQVPAHQKQYMTRTEVMKELGMSAPKFRRAFANGGLDGEVLQMGKQHVYRVKVSSVEEYKRRHQWDAL